MPRQAARMPEIRRHRIVREDGHMRWAHVHLAINHLPVILVTGFGGLLTIGALAANRQPAWLVPVVIAVALLATLILARTANLGGQISHPEIRGTTYAAGRPAA
jgi:hypothetical protein